MAAEETKEAERHGLVAHSRRRRSRRFRRHRRNHADVPHAGGPPEAAGGGARAEWRRRRRGRRARAAARGRNATSARRHNPTVAARAARGGQSRERRRRRRLLRTQRLAVAAAAGARAERAAVSRRRRRRLRFRCHCSVARGGGSDSADDDEGRLADLLERERDSLKKQMARRSRRSGRLRGMDASYGRTTADAAAGNAATRAAAARRRRRRRNHRAARRAASAVPTLVSLAEMPALPRRAAAAFAPADGAFCTGTAATAAAAPAAAAAVPAALSAATVGRDGCVRSTAGSTAAVSRRPSLAGSNTQQQPPQQPSTQWRHASISRRSTHRSIRDRTARRRCYPPPPSHPHPWAGGEAMADLQQSSPEPPASPRGRRAPPRTLSSGDREEMLRTPYIDPSARPIRTPAELPPAVPPTPFPAQAHAVRASGSRAGQLLLPGCHRPFLQARRRAWMVAALLPDRQGAAPHVPADATEHIETTVDSSLRHSLRTDSQLVYPAEEALRRWKKCRAPLRASGHIRARTREGQTPPAVAARLDARRSAAPQRAAARLRRLRRRRRRRRLLDLEPPPHMHGGVPQPACLRRPPCNFRSRRVAARGRRQP